MVFLLHPVQAESVAWIAERKGLLATCFFLLSWLGYLRYRDGGALAGRFYGISLAAFLCSLLAKSMTVILPVMLVMYDWCHPSGTGRLKLKDKIPYAVLAALAGGMEIYSSLLQPGGSKGVYHGGSALATLYTMLPVFCRYLGLLLWPAGLSIDYDPPVHQRFDGVVLLSALMLALVVCVMVMLCRRDRKLIFWVGFFWLCLVPVSQIIPTGFIMFDHYLYLPVISMGVLVGVGAAYLKERMLPQNRWVLYLALTTWLSVLSAVSFNRTGDWKNALTLFTDTVRKSPHSFMAWWGLGNVYEGSGKNDLALSAYKRASELNPDSTDVLYTLAAMYLKTGAPDEALPRLRRLLELNPLYVRGWAALGQYHRLKNDFTRAGEVYLKALELQPDAVEVMLALASLAASQGDVAPTIVWLEKAFKEGWRDYQALYLDQDFAAVRTDPRFIAFEKRAFPKGKSME
jgi:Tfp pilus assembly protein PilF